MSRADFTSDPSCCAVVSGGVDFFFDARFFFEVLVAADVVFFLVFFFDVGSCQLAGLSEPDDAGDVFGSCSSAGLLMSADHIR